MELGPLPTTGNKDNNSDVDFDPQVLPKKYKLKANEHFIDYKFVEMADGTMKRKKVFRRVYKKIKQLTEEQMEEINNAFILFDKDRSGSIDVNELKDAMKALGIFLTKEELKHKMYMVDKDGSGAIDKKEFMSLMAEQIDARNQQEELRKVFRIFDGDDTGLITRGNLIQCAIELQEDVTTKELE